MFKRILKFSLKKVINTVVRHLLSSLLVDYLVLIGVFVFLWFFYSAVADRIFPTADRVLATSSGIVEPLAYKTSFSDGNFLVILFPFIFFCLAMLVHHYWDKGHQLVIILVCIFVFDYVAASVSSRKVHQYHTLNEFGYEGSWSFWFWASDYYDHVAIVVLCGFGTTLAAGMLYHALKKIVDVSDEDTDMEE